MKTLLLVLGTAILVYVAIGIVLWRAQERILFQPPRELVPTPSPGARLLDVRAPDGVRIPALVIGEPAGAGRPPVLMFHGNAVLAPWMIPWAAETARRFKTTVVLAEYRGYGAAGGVASYPATAIDARATLEAASRSLGVPANEFVLYGHSLGTAVAAELAAAVRPRALVLESPFTSARAMVDRWLVVGNRFGWSLLSRIHFDTIERVRGLEAPVSVVHGERDALIPVRMGREVFSAAGRRGQLLIVPDAGHNDVSDIGGEAYWEWLGAVLAAAR